MKQYLWYIVEEYREEALFYVGLTPGDIAKTLELYKKGVNILFKEGGRSEYFDVTFYNVKTDSIVTAKKKKKKRKKKKKKKRKKKKKKKEKLHGDKGVIGRINQLQGFGHDVKEIEFY